MSFIQELEDRFEGVKDPLIATQQAAYMKNLFPFLGIKKPERSIIQKELFAKHPPQSEAALIAHVFELWKRPEREYQMVALDLTYTYKKLWTPEMFPILEQLIRSKSWWDSVDTIASKLMGPLLKKYPDLELHMDSWIEDDYMWIRRTALIYQLSYKHTTNQERLFRYCRLRMGEKEFFIRKAIGWSLRQYAHSNPHAVRQFVEQEKAHLSPLSYREATKHITHL